MPHLWHLTVKGCFNNVSFNVVAEVLLNNGCPAILKCGVPSKEFMNEVAALQHFNSLEAVKLLDAEAGADIMLLERLLSGTLLEEVPDETQCTITSVELIQCACQKILEKWYQLLHNWALSLSTADIF